MKATLRDLAGVGLKLLGVYALICLISRADGVFMLFGGLQGMTSTEAVCVAIPWAFGSALYLGAAVVLLVFTDRVLKLLFGDGPAGQVEAIPNAHVDGIAFFVAGVIVLLRGLAHVVRVFSAHVMASSGGPLGVLRQLVHDSMPGIILYGLELALGIAGIIYGARRLRKSAKRELPAQ